MTANLSGRECKSSIPKHKIWPCARKKWCRHMHTEVHAIIYTRIITQGRLSYGQWDIQFTQMVTKFHLSHDQVDIRAFHAVYDKMNTHAYKMSPWYSEQSSANHAGLLALVWPAKWHVEDPSAKRGALVYDVLTTVLVHTNLVTTKTHTRSWNGNIDLNSPFYFVRTWVRLRSVRDFAPKTLFLVHNCRQTSQTQTCSSYSH